MDKITIKRFLNCVDERMVDNKDSVKATIKDYDEKSCIVSFANDPSEPIVVKIPGRNGHKRLFDSLKERFGESILLTSYNPMGYYIATLITSGTLVVTFDNITMNGQKWLANMYKERTKI